MAGAGKKGSKTKTRDADEKTQQNGVEPTDPVTLNAINSDTIADAIVKAFSSTDVLQRLQPILTEALKASVTDAVLTSVNDALNLELQSRDTKIAELETQNVNLKAEIEDLEQYSRRNCLIVHGLEEKEGKDTDKVIQSFAKTHLKMDLKEQDIDRSHRLGRPHRPTGVATRRPQTRPIIIKFIRYNAWSNFYSLKKELKGSKFYKLYS